MALCDCEHCEATTARALDDIDAIRDEIAEAYMRGFRLALDGNPAPTLDAAERLGRAYVAGWQSGWHARSSAQRCALRYATDAVASMASLRGAK